MFTIYFLPPQGGWKPSSRPVRARYPGSPAQCLRRQLFVLSEACIPSDVNQVGWKLHALKEDLAGQWAIRVSGNWRLTLVITPL
ncbi:TPA: type II toxin-antitoxin system RelE/ParE family toxin, partial [Pseudomonas aeruginosa]|nr:type II toxin-antitoxin system RelE/ParE family toxin [Pseudomonas aeruginosa]